MAPNCSRYLPRAITNTTAVAGAAAGVAALCVYYVRRQRTAKLPRSNGRVKQDVEVFAAKQVPNAKAQVDSTFFRELWELVRIIVPGWRSREAGLLVAIAATLVARSMCDLWLIANSTKIESAIVAMDKERFQRRLLRFVLAMPVISLVNNVLKYSIGDLKIRLRTNLTRRLYDAYLRKHTYYRMSHLDTRIANADQLLTTDVDKFCECVADLYTNIAKPSLDIGIYVYKLTASLGGGTPTLMLGYLVGSGLLLTRLRRPVSRLTAEEQRLEGDFRHVNARLITYAEEVAFYNGNEREKTTLLASYARLTAHLRRFLRFRAIMGVVDNLVAKYFASCVGFWAVSIPFLSASHALLADAGHEGRQMMYYTYGRMLVKLAEAIGRVVLAGRELGRLAGYTTRVTQLRRVLDELNAGSYQRTMVAGSAPPPSPHSGRMVFRERRIEFDRVPLVTPNGDVLIAELSFAIETGMNVLVCGPNGAGKSSLFRCLGELWPLFGGVLTKPPSGKLFYIPQKPYMTLGTLRDQLTYPHSAEEAARRGASDEDLIAHLERVQLGYLLAREVALDAVADWLDVLSGGEKQRVAMARLFYHAPQFAILDECTSAVSVDVEGSIYRYCRAAGITLLTVSHRRSLWQHHEFVLHLDGRGAYEFKRIDADTPAFGS